MVERDGFVRDFGAPPEQRKHLFVPPLDTRLLIISRVNFDG